MSLACDGAQVRRIAAALTACYGTPQHTPSDDPVGELVATILSQSTTDQQSGQAYRALRETFPDWDAVQHAPPEHLAATIRGAGLAMRKAGRIQQALAHLHRAHGAYTLEPLRAMSPAAGRAWLTRLPGVGPKTASCVLVFALGVPAIPVDTHVHRIARRSAMIGPRVSADQAHGLLEAELAPQQALAFHLNLIRHGKTVCRALRPACDRCPLAAYCPRHGVGP